jgi:UDP-glucose 6-dehydrogenase
MARLSIAKMRARSALLGSSASSALLATKVSFINTIADTAQKILGADVGTIAESIGAGLRGTN